MKEKNPWDSGWRYYLLCVVMFIVVIAILVISFFLNSYRWGGCQ